MTQPYPQYPGAPAAPQQYGNPGYPGGYPQPATPPYGNATPAQGPYGLPYQAPPAPQSAPPAAPVPPQPAAPSMGQGITPPPPTLRDGGSTGGAAAPKMRHLVGRTVIIEPVRMGKANVKGKEIDEATFHLTVVDGGPIRYGDNIDDRDISKNRPNTHEVDTPCRFVNVTDIGYGPVTTVREALDAGEAGRLGVVQQGTQGNRPFLITKTSTDVFGNERPDGEARFAAAMELFSKIWADRHSAPGTPKQFVNPTPRSLVAPGPAAGAPQVNYGTPAPSAYDPAYAAAAQHAMPTPAPAYAPPAVPQQYAVPSAAYPVAGMQSYQPQGAPPAAPPAPAGQLPPHIEAWLASLPADQQAQQRAALIQSAPPAYAPPAQPAGPGI